MTSIAKPPRVRDPARKEKILAAGARLIARGGYHSVSMADIGAEAGITGSGIYRHFESKAAILVAIFDQVIDEMLAENQRLMEPEVDLPQAMNRLIEEHIDFVINARPIAQVYHNEIANVPAQDRRRLRRKQRQYVEDWVHVLRELRPEFDDAQASTMVHAAIGAIQSPLFHNVGLDQERLRMTLAVAAQRVLTVAASPEAISRSGRTFG